MAMLKLRISRDSDVQRTIARLRRFQKAHGQGQVARRSSKKLERAASEGLILYCEDGRSWIGACGVMFEHAHQVKHGRGRKRPRVVLFFIEAGGGAVHKRYQSVGVVTLLLILGTLAALAKAPDDERVYFLVASPNKPRLGPYEQMPAPRSAMAIAAARYAKNAGITIGKTHRYYEFAPDAYNAQYRMTNRLALRVMGQEIIADFERGRLCTISGKTIDVDFSDVIHDFLRWGVHT